MTADLDDLLGPSAPPPPERNKGGRPTKAEAERRMAERLASEATQKEIREAGMGRTKVDAREFSMPVAQNFLARVFNMDPMTVNKRLTKCKPIGSVGNGRPVYDFKTACEYLLKPRMDIETYLKTLNPTDMPNSINKVYWEALRIKLKYEIEAGEAWATEDVLEVFGSVFMTIKDRTQLWVEKLRDTGLTDVQSTKMMSMVDAYQSELHSALIEFPKQRQTRSKIVGIEIADQELREVSYDPIDPLG